MTQKSDHATFIWKTHHHLSWALRTQSELPTLVSKLCKTWPRRPLLTRVLSSPPCSLCLCPLLSGRWPVPSPGPRACPCRGPELLLCVCTGWLSLLLQALPTGHPLRIRRPSPTTWSSGAPSPPLCPMPACFFPNMSSHCNCSVGSWHTYCLASPRACRFQKGEDGFSRSCWLLLPSSWHGAWHRGGGGSEGELPDLGVKRISLF